MTSSVQCVAFDALLDSRSLKAPQIRCRLPRSMFSRANGSSYPPLGAQLKAGSECSQSPAIRETSRAFCSTTYVGYSLTDLIDGILQKQVHTVYVDRGEVFRQVRCFQVRQYRESLRSHDPAACPMSRVFSFQMYMSTAAFRYFRPLCGRQMQPHGEQQDWLGCRLPAAGNLRVPMSWTALLTPSRTPSVELEA